MSFTCQSETGKLRSLLLKRVSDAWINEKLVHDQWEQLHFLSKPDLTKAVEEYSAFEAIFHNRGIEIHYLREDISLTMDSLYCRDASIATDAGMIICNMGKQARKGEPKAEQEAFMKAGIPVLGEIAYPGTLEGGDVAWLDQHTLAVGYTYRTNLHGIGQLREMLAPLGIEVIKADLPHYRGPADVFHLMSVFSPVDKDLAVVFSPLLPIAFRNQLLDRGYRLVEVPEQEFDTMGCNVLALAPRDCLVTEGSPKTRELLERAGCHVHTYMGHEISVKGGGGPTCLTRPVLRELT